MSKEKEIGKKEAARDKKYFNFWRKWFQFFVSHVLFMIRFKLVYRLEVIGKENIPKDSNYIIASNHMSTLDPPLMGAILDKPIAYMSKKELFANPFMRWWLNWLGAFAVDREKLSVSTIKTAITISKTDWVLGIFPQGTREPAGKITKFSRGFTAIAKASKCGILPVGFIGTDEAKWIPFSGKIVVKIGKLIPYSDNVDGMADKWLEDIQQLTGFEYTGK